MTATARRRPKRVDLTKPTRPTTVEAGGLTWTAAEDDTPCGARIGWALAVEVGVPPGDAA